MKKILFPKKVIGFLLCLISTILLIVVFGNHLEDTPLAYFSYLLSTYALIVFILWFIDTCRFHNPIKKLKIYQWYQENILIVTKYQILFSSLFNLLFGLYEFGLGLYSKSWWFITFSLYYLVLCVVKSSLLFQTENLEKDTDKERTKLKNSGIILLFLNIILTGIIILMIHQERTITYHGYLIYGVALYDFYLIIVACINFFRYKKKNSPILFASKCISLTVAMISMLSLEVAMVYQFGNNDLEFKNITTSIMGFVIVFVNTTLSILMIKKGKTMV